MKKLITNIGDTINNCEVISINESHKDTKVRLRCKVCGKEFNKYNYQFRSGRISCSHIKNRTSTRDYIGKELNGFKIMSIVGRDIIDSRVIVRVQCNSCGELCDVILHDLQSSKIVCDCLKKNNYRESFYSKYNYLIGTNDGVDTVIELNYYPDRDNNNRAMIKLKCNDCGATREVSVTSYVSKKGNTKKCNCKPKTRTLLNPLDRYNQIYLNKTFGKLTVIGFSNGTTLQNTVAFCKCGCGNDFCTMLSNLVSGDTLSCGCKHESNGERIIRERLSQLKVIFTTQQKMTDLFSRSGKHLTFDFMIFEHNTSKGIAVIEFDGPHHYLPGNFYGTNTYNIYDNNHYDSSFYDTRLSIIQENDKIKDDYVISHGCKIYRIKSTTRKTDKCIIQEVDDIINDISKQYNCFK